MAYITCSRVPGRTIADFRSVTEELGGEPPAGRLACFVGEADGALQVIDVWTSRTDSDRFATERLFPAFVRTGLGPGADSSFVAFDAALVEGVA
jgi:hypothetical protein